MLDVHAPEHPITGRREFFVHLATITVGLLIALALENAAEAVHHHFQRHEAEEKIRAEIRTNLAGLKKNTATFEEERQAMKQLIATLRGIQEGKPLELTSMKVSFHEEEIPDAAWRTASSTGVLEHMPYDEVEAFADAYREQALLQTMLQRTLEDYLELTPMLDHKPTREDAAAILPVAVRTLGHLNGVGAAGVGTAQSYEAALQ